MFRDTKLGPVSLELAAAPLPFELWAMMVVGVSIPEPRGVFTYDHRRKCVKLHWPKEAGQRAYDAVLATMDELDDASSSGFLVDFDGLTGKVSFHPLGGAVLGKACDFYGRVKGYKGLYVTDAALIPGSAGCGNPGWTIGAIVERCMDNILADI
jgi:cholesterol oxidase